MWITKEKTASHKAVFSFRNLEGLFVGYMTECAGSADADANTVLGNKASCGFVSVPSACECGEFDNRCSAI